jgi:predicted tellurium resistance membrane protein TerC
MDAQFWSALLENIGVNIVPFGDNAAVNALACRSLPRHQQRIGIALGAGAAIAMRVGFTAIIVAIGAALIGYVAGEVIVTDPLIAHWVDAHVRWLHWVAPLFEDIGPVLLAAAMAGIVEFFARMVVRARKDRGVA